MTPSDKRVLKKMLSLISLMRRDGPRSLWYGARSFRCLYGELHAQDEPWNEELCEHILPLELAGIDYDEKREWIESQEYHDLQNEALDRLEELVLGRFPGGIVPTKDEEEEDEEEDL